MPHLSPQRPASRRGPRRARALALLSALACGAAVRADIDIQIDGVDAELRRNVLIFLSLSRYSDRDDLDQALLERLQERSAREVSAALKPFGYYEPQSRTEIARTSATGWRARIDINPGKPVVIEQFSLQVLGPGASDPAFQQIRSTPGLRAGARLNHGVYEATKGALQRTAATLGYLDARLVRSDLQVDLANHRASAALVLETGERYRFGATSVEQTAINDALLRRFLRYQTDEPFDATKLLSTQFALDDSQYFSTVEVLPGELDRAQRVIPVNIRAQPNRRHRYQFGIGYGSDTDVRGTASWDNRLVNQRGHRLRTELKLSSTTQLLEGRYIIPIRDPALEKLGFQLSAKDEDLADLSTRSLQFEPSVTNVLGRWQRVLFGRFLRTTTRGTNVVQPSGVAGEITDTLFIPGISYASVPRGYLGEALFSRALYAELRGSGGFLGSDSEFLQLRVQAERVIDLGTAWHLLLRGELGASVVNRFSVLPGSERFFAGGDRSVRGFGYNELSPLDATGAKVGGRHLMTGTVEVIRDLPRNFGVAFFADGGNAFDKFGDPLQYSVGIGFRWRLPVVTIGVDIAQALTNPSCKAVDPDPRCASTPGFDRRPGPRLHLNFSPKL